MMGQLQPGMRVFVVLAISVALTITFGCQWDKNPSSSGYPGVDGAKVAPEAPPPQAEVSFLILPREMGAGLRPEIRSDSTTGSTSVRVQLTLLNPLNPDKPVSVLSKTAPVTSSGTAVVSFSGIPVVPVIGAFQIDGGRIGSDSEFHGATDLVPGRNVLNLVPRNDGSKTDLVAKVLEQGLGNATMSGKIVQGVVSLVEKVIDDLGASASVSLDQALGLIDRSLNGRGFVFLGSPRIATLSYMSDGGSTGPFRYYWRYTKGRGVVIPVHFRLPGDPAEIEMVLGTERSATSTVEFRFQEENDIQSYGTFFKVASGQQEFLFPPMDRVRFGEKLAIGLRARGATQSYVLSPHREFTFEPPRITDIVATFSPGNWGELLVTSEGFFPFSDWYVYLTATETTPPQDLRGPDLLQSAGEPSGTLEGNFSANLDSFSKLAYGWTRLPGMDVTLVPPFSVRTAVSSGFLDYGRRYRIMGCHFNSSIGYNVTRKIQFEKEVSIPNPIQSVQITNPVLVEVPNSLKSGPAKVFGHRLPVTIDIGSISPDLAASGTVWITYVTNGTLKYSDSSITGLKSGRNTYYVKNPGVYNYEDRLSVFARFGLVGLSVGSNELAHAVNDDPNYVYIRYVSLWKDGQITMNLSHSPLEGEGWSVEYEVKRSTGVEDTTSKGYLPISNIEWQATGVYNGSPYYNVVIPFNFDSWAGTLGSCTFSATVQLFGPNGFNGPKVGAENVLQYKWPR